MILDFGGNVSNIGVFRVEHVFEILKSHFISLSCCEVEGLGQPDDDDDDDNNNNNKFY